MHLGIDATNIRQGGGVTHLVQLLSAASPQEQGISKITVWCSPWIAPLLPKQPWLNVRSGAWTAGGSLKRFFFQHLLLSLEMRSVGCEMAFFPGSTLPLISLLPAVTISQNMLPFELDKAALFGTFSLMYLKFCVLRVLQSISFKRAIGVIFLSKYAQENINKIVSIKGRQTIISHGIDPVFYKSPRDQLAIENYSFDRPFRFVYVSILMPYKHQIQVAEAISELREEGLPISCDFIGPKSGKYGAKLLSLIALLDPNKDFLNYLGEIPYKELPTHYHGCEGFIFASSCENLPNILIEAMASGVPIACSSKGPMPDVLGKEGFYFDPESKASISKAIKCIISLPEKGMIVSENAYKNAQNYSWVRCSRETWSFISALK